MQRLDRLRKNESSLCIFLKEQTRKMGRKKYRRNVMAGVDVMSPIQELSGESRSPTPVDAGKAGESARNRELRSGDSTPCKENRSDSEAEILEQIHAETSFTDRLQNLVEEYTREIISKDKELRRERGMKRDLMIEYWNYKLSWVREKAKFKEVEKQLENRDTEYSKLKTSYATALRENHKLKKSVIGSGRSSTEEEQVDNVPAAPQTQVKGQRRPYTGKSRDQLPPITANNKVVTSSVYVPSPPSKPAKPNSPVQLPAIVPSPPKFLPSPPKLLRPRKSKSPSRIPLPLRVRRAS